MLQVLITLELLVTDRVERMKNARGATAVEYGLMVALIAAVIIVVVTALGGGLRDKFDDVCGAVTGGDCAK
jgi:pilus assembly protein Flp/PilA